MQLRHHATFMQPFQCDLQTQTQETHRTTYTGTSSVTKHIEGTKRPQPHPPHRRGTFHRRLQPLYTEKHKVSCSGFLPTTKPMQHSCSHSNAICKHKLKKRIELRTQDHPVLKHIEGTKRPQPHPPHRQGTFHRRLQPLYTEKHKVSCSGFLPTTKPMQHSCSHSNAICKHKLKKRIELRTQDHPVLKHIEGTKRPQPHPPHRQGTFHRRLQPLYTEKPKVSYSGFLPNTKPMQHSCSHSNAICHHSSKKRIELRTQEQPLIAKHRRNNSRQKRPQPQPPHRRGTFHRRLQPLYTEKHKVSCSGFLPTTKPMQHSCSHSNAICKHKLKKRIELRTQEHPVLQNTLKERNDPSRTRRTDEVPFIVACSHFTRKNTRFRAPASSPQQSPCNIHAAIPMRSANTNSRNA